MEYITLENTDLRVSRFCMGGCPLGGYGWGNVRDDELVASVGRALECGVNFLIRRIHTDWGIPSLCSQRDSARTARTW